MPEDRTLLIVFHSLTGGTRAMAGAVAEGAAGEETVRVRLRHASAAGAEDVLAADGYVFASPETLGGIAGLMKDFFDRTYYAALDRIQGRPCAVLVCAGSDGTQAAQRIGRIATGWRLRPVAPPLIIRTGAQSPEAILAPKAIAEADLARCRELGAALAAGLAAGIF